MTSVVVELPPAQGVVTANSVVKCWASSWSLVTSVGTDPGAGDFCDVTHFINGHISPAGLSDQSVQ